jgi:isopentenyl phosphate kinase
VAGPCRLAAVKLGGSLVTVKSKPYTLNPEALRAAALQLSAYRRRGDLIVVHGGGSFGHAEVERLRSLHGGRLPAAAAGRVQRAMLSLACSVADSLLDAGLPASVHPAHTLCGCSRCGYEPLLRDLREGLVPVTYGDAVACGGETVIVSGDRLVVEAALEAGADCVVFAIDKPGVIGPEGRVLGELHPGGRVASLSSGSPDVTGGLGYKLEWAFRAAGEGLRVVIVGGDLLLKALRGEPAGTRIVV